MVFSLIGFGLDIIGVLMLFKYGILPNKILNSILQDNSLSEEDEKRHKLFSKISIILIVIGFIFQSIGTVSQNRNTELVYSVENKKLGIDCNVTKGICGNLKLKLDENKMSYFISIKGKKSTIDSILNFTIELQDGDGFKIEEINEPKDSPNITNIINPKSKDSLLFVIKSSINITEKKYLNIKKWDLILR